MLWGDGLRATVLERSPSWHGEDRFEEEPHMAAIHRLIGLQSALRSLQEYLTEHSQPRCESHIA